MEKQTGNQATVEKTGTEVIEIAACTIKPGKTGEYREARPEVLAWLKMQPGFQSIKTYNAHGDENLFIDYCSWESLDQARQAGEKFQSAPELAKFREAIAEVKLFDHFSQSPTPENN